MISLEVNGRELVIDASTQITLEEVSPLFVHDSIPVPYTLPFQLPICPVNDAAIGYLKDFDIVVQTGLDYVARLNLHGRIIKGLLIITDVADVYEVAVIPDRQRFNPDKLLTDYDWGEKLNVGNTGSSGNWFKADCLDKIVKEYPDTTYNYPIIRNERVYVFGPLTLDKYVNFYETDTTNTPPSTWNPYRKALLFSPQVYMLHVLNTVLDQSGLKVNGLWVTDVDILQLLFYNNKVYSDDNPDLDIYMKDHIPEITTTELLNGLRNMFNIGMLFDFEAGTVRIEKVDDILSDDRIVDISEDIYQAHSVPSYKTVSSFKFTNKNDSADKQVQKIVNTVSFNNGYIAVENSSYLPGSGSPNRYLVLNENFFYQYNYLGAVWEKAGYNYINFNTEVGPQATIDVPIGAVTSQKHNCDVATVTRTWMTPVVEMDYDTNKFTPRLYFYRGIQPAVGPASPTYPKGTITNIGIGNGDPLIGNLCLHWNGTYGLYEKCWKNWVDTLKVVRQYNVTGRFNESKLNTITMFDKVKINNRTFLIGRRRTTYTMTDILDTEMELYRL